MDGYDDRTEREHAEVGWWKVRHVGEKQSDPVSRSDALTGEGCRVPARLLPKIAISDPLGPEYHCRPGGMAPGRFS